MRLIVLNDHGFINGGGAQVAISSLNALAAAGIDVTFVSSVGPIDTTINNDLVKSVNFNQFDLRNNPSLVQAAFKGLWNFQSANSFEQLLSEYNPIDTVIHLHTWVSSLSSSIVYIAKKKGFKIVCTLHDYSTVCPNSGLYNFVKSKNCDLKPMSLKCLACNCDSRSYKHKLWRVLRHQVQSKLGKIKDDIDLFITVSKYSENLLRPHFPPNTNFLNIGNPINIEKQAPVKVGNNNDFTFIGRLSVEKGGVLFAEAANIANVKSVFVGSGSEEEKIKEINPTSIFMGWQKREGVISAINSSRVIVFPSLLHEAQPLIVMEAAALGVPVLASDECAAKDFIIDGVTGMLFKSRNSKDLSEKLQILNNDTQLVEHLAKNAYEHYWSNPSTMEVHVNKLIACYKDILMNKLQK